METRSHSFGEDHKLTFVDRFGIWLSNRRILKLVKDGEVRSVADIGSGFDANLSRSLRTLVSRSVVVDVALSDEMVSSPEFETYVGSLPDVLGEIPQRSIDLVILNSVLEHLDYPIESLEGIKLLMADGGTLFVNVPTWFGKVLLEFLAFKLRLSPQEEMEDHRRYYSKRELWLALRTSGFTPSKIRIRRHKLWTNVYAIVTV
jgi:trans-aconitate methyltransferase